MRKTLLSVALLSTFAIAQNVLVVSAAPDPGSVSGGIAAAPERAARFLRSAEVGEQPAQRPPAGSLSLFVAGLAGLVVAGGRRAERRGATA